MLRVSFRYLFISNTAKGYYQSIRPFYAFASVQLRLSVRSCTIWAKMPPACSSSAGEPCSATAPSLSTTILSAPETVRIRWAMMRTALFLIRWDSTS